MPCTNWKLFKKALNIRKSQTSFSVNLQGFHILCLLGFLWVLWFPPKNYFTQEHVILYDLGDKNVIVNKCLVKQCSSLFVHEVSVFTQTPGFYKKGHGHISQHLCSFISGGLFAQAETVRLFPSDLSQQRWRLLSVPFAADANREKTWMIGYHLRQRRLGVMSMLMCVNGSNWCSLSLRACWGVSFKIEITQL